jgi:uncharacterized protein (UPF0335 family)
MKITQEKIDEFRRNSEELLIAKRQLKELQERILRIEEHHFNIVDSLLNTIEQLQKENIRLQGN